MDDGEWHAPPTAYLAGGILTGDAMAQGEDARTWLTENGYADVARLIDRAIEVWRSDGLKTRRNWWDILAGDRLGHPRKVRGREFPVLRAAQLRQGRRVTENAMFRGEKTKPPRIVRSGRWPKA